MTSQEIRPERTTIIITARQMWAGLGALVFAVAALVVGQFVVTSAITNGLQQSVTSLAGRLDGETSKNSERAVGTKDVEMDLRLQIQNIDKNTQNTNEQVVGLRADVNKYYETWAAASKIADTNFTTISAKIENISQRLNAIETKMNYSPYEKNNLFPNRQNDLELPNRLNELEQKLLPQPQPQ